MKCYDIVVPTTPQVDKQTRLLKQENWSDLILLRELKLNTTRRYDGMSI